MKPGKRSLQPNPFRAATALHILWPQSALVRLIIDDALGRRVRTLVEEVRPAEPPAAAWMAGTTPDHRPPAGLLLAVAYRWDATGKVTPLR